MNPARLIPIVIIVAVSAYFLISSYYSSLPEAPETEYLTVQINGRDFELEIADTDEKRSTGLSGRPAMEEERGMIFVFDRAARHGIWMRGMKFPLDIVWLSGNRVVDIVENAQPNFDSNPQVYYPDIESDKVIELYAGAAARTGLDIGDILLLPKFGL